MELEIGTTVIIIGTGVVGVITAIRIGVTTSRVMKQELCDHNPDVELPDYVEIDDSIQVHPSRVEEV